MVRLVFAVLILFTSYGFAETKKEQQALIADYVKLLQNGEAPLGSEMDFRLIVEKANSNSDERNVDIKNVFVFNYSRYKTDEKVQQLPDNEYNATDILLAPSLFYNQVQKSLAANVLNDPCINKFGELKLDPFCQAAAKAAYFKQKINHYDDWATSVGITQ